MLLNEIQAIEKQFELPISFSLLAFFTFSMTGALAGLRRGYDFIGVIFLAMITACGGGLIRDGLLISKGPAVIVTDPRYLSVVFAAALLTFFFQGLAHRLNRLIAVVDALGLGAFAVHGVQLSLSAGLSVPAAILGGTLTAVGGGVMRDVLVREEPLLFKPGQFYALVAIGGCCLFVALLRWADKTPNDAALITIVFVTVVRLLAIRFNWRTTAVSVTPEPPAKG
jgi:uncharacterized membrane protein YeiH